MSLDSYRTLTGSLLVSTAEMFYLQTLGRLDVRTANGTTPQGVQTRPKDLVLLAYLAASPFGLHRRDTLLAMLWPELDQAHGRNALSQALHRIRAFLEPGVLLTQGKDSVGLSPRRFSCDALAFEKHLEDGEVGRALRLYAGDFLAGVHVSGVAPEFDDWIVTERERLQRLAFNAVLVLIEVEEKSGDDQSAIAWLRRARAMRPCDETVCRRLIEALAAADDRTGALTEYENFARQLGDEYGLSPSARTRAIPEALRRARTPGLSETRRPGRAHPAVVEAFLKGRYFTSTIVETARGLEHLQAALERDPAYAPAHAATALSIVNLALLGHLPPEDARVRAESAARRAAGLDPGLGEAHTALAMVATMFDWDWKRAEREFRIGISCNSNSSDAHTYYAQFLCAVGRPEEGVAAASVAQQLDPLGLWTNFTLAWALFRARRHDDSIRRLQELLELYPHFAFAHLFVAENQLQRGAYAEATNACRNALDILPEDQLLLGLTACVAGLSGERDLAHRLRHRLEVLARSRDVCPGHLAAAHLGLGDRDGAFDRWQAMCRDRWALAPLVPTDPLYDCVRDDPRFDDMLRRMNLANSVQDIPRRAESAR